MTIDPNQRVANLRGWWKADDDSTITLDGSNNVSQWDDKSGNGNHLGQSNSGRRPSYETSTGRIRHDNGDFLRRPYVDIYPSRTVFYVFNADNVSNEMRPLTQNASGPNAAGNYMGLRLRANSSNTISFFGGDEGASVATTNSYTETENQLFSAVSTENSTIEVFINGESGGSATNGGFVDVGNGTSDLLIGTNRSDTASSRYNGYSCELLLFDAELTTKERQLIEGYLAWEWGLQYNLQETHPYRYGAPGKLIGNFFGLGA